MTERGGETNEARPRIARRPFSEGEIAYVKQAWPAGVPWGEMRQHLPGCPRARVCYLAGRLGLHRPDGFRGARTFKNPARKCKKHLSNQEKTLFQRMWNDGCDIDDLEAEFRISRTSVYRMSRELGLRKDNRKTKSGNAGNRKCLKCHRPFPSEGVHNRICDGCKFGEVWENNAGCGSCTLHVAAIEDFKETPS